MVEKGIQAQVNGKLGIGGLFVSNDFVTKSSFQREGEVITIQRRIYNRWYEFSPLLNKFTSSIQENQQPLLLHAALKANAPADIIKDILNQFKYCILKRDDKNRLPIDLAVEEGLKIVKKSPPRPTTTTARMLSDNHVVLNMTEVEQFDRSDEIMQSIIEATAMAVKEQGSSSIYVASQYGLKWSSQIMNELVGSSVDEILNGCNTETGFCPFMVAAMGKYSCCDLSSIYGLMRMSPQEIRKY